MGFFAPSWSPDGRYIAANSTRSPAVMLFDVQTSNWSELESGTGILRWSPDSKFLYYLQYKSGPAIVRVRISDRKVERVASLLDIHLTGFMAGLGFGLGSDGTPIILRDSGTEEIYSLDWHTRPTGSLVHAVAKSLVPYRQRSARRSTRFPMLLVRSGVDTAICVSR